jgi:SNF2 family DNA or RNA helicase
MRKRLRADDDEGGQVQDDLRDLEHPEKIIKGEMDQIVFRPVSASLMRVDDIFSFAVQGNQKRTLPPSTVFRDPSQLKPYQREGLGWMLSREGYESPLDTIDVSDWVQVSGQQWFNAKLNIATTQEPVQAGPGHRRRPPKSTVNPVWGGIMADEMGLGKTVQMISLISTHPAPSTSGSGAKSTLVVVPPILLINWKREIRKWSRLSVLVHYGPDRERRPARVRFGEYDVVLTSYKLFGSVDAPLFQSHQWWRVVLDEGHKIRNPIRTLSQRAYTVPARNRWILSGTPIQNDWMDLFSLFKFLHVRPYGELYAWMSLIQNPLTRGEPWRFYATQAEQTLKTLVRSLVLRRTKSTRVRNGEVMATGQLVSAKDQFYPIASFQWDRVILQDQDRKLAAPYNRVTPLDTLVHIPPKQVDLEWMYFQHDQERTMYNRVFQEGRTSAGGDQVKNVLEYLLRLRQATIHPWLPLPREERIQRINEVVRDKTRAWQPSTKFDYIVGQLRETDNILGNRPTEKSLVFSQFTGALDLLEIALQKAGWINPASKKYRQNPAKWRDRPLYVRIDGSTSQDQRESRLEKLDQDDSVKLAILSLHATALGLNMTRANNVYFLDLFFNPQIHAQAIDRTHRIGQTRPVQVKFPLIRGTVDESLNRLFKYKKSIADFSLNPVVVGKDKVLDLLK